MIVIDLCCAHGHHFEGWFASADDFSSQSEHKLVSCPVCASTTVERLPSAPYLQTRTASPARSKTAPAAGADPDSTTMRRMLTLLREMSSKAEDVGERLPEEARRIHYGESEARDIRGQASSEEVISLLEEGIMVLPVLPGKDELH